MELQDKVVVVTGAGNGVGMACVRRFANEGAHVVAVDVEDGSAEAVASEVGGLGVTADMTRQADVEMVIEKTRRQYGRVDVWFSNAGVSGPRQPGELQENELWRAMWDLHVMSHVYAARVLLPEMLERGSGYLLQTVSRVALGTHPAKAAYTVSKHAGLALGEWMAAQYREGGVKVSCFCPGAMRTRMLASNDLPAGSTVLKDAIDADEAAGLVLAGIRAERFLILTPDANLQALTARATDYEAWIAGSAGSGVQTET